MSPAIFNYELYLIVTVIFILPFKILPFEANFLVLLLILSTIPWGLSKLWGGGVPTLDIDHSGPRICRLLLRTLINPAPTSPPAVRCLVYPVVFSFLPPYGIIRPPGRHMSLSQHNKISPSPPPPSPAITRFWLFRTFLTLTTPAKFLSPPLPCRCQNLF